MIALVIAAALLAAGGATGEEAVVEESAVEESALAGLPVELQGQIETFYASIENADVEARIELMHDDIVMMPNHWTMSRGKETVAEMFRATVGTVFRLKDREVVDAKVDGGVAYTVNSYYYTWHEEGDEPQWHKTKNIHIWHQCDDGVWRLRLDIWNSDVPIAQFAEE